MKKFALILTTFLVLITSMFFSACGKDYSKIKIECNRESLNLTIHEESERQGVIFEISGVKSWGKVSVDSKPSGAVTVEEVKTDGKKCYVIVKGVQPTDNEAELIITHLASGKQGSIPLTVGLKLQDVESNGKSLVVDIPDKIEDENGQIKEGIKQYSISVKDVLNTTPANYSDSVIWVMKNSEHAVKGVELKYYLSNGELATDEQVFTANDEQTNIDTNHIQGTTKVVKSVFEISSLCENGTEITLIPISVLGENATKYNDVEVKVNLIDILTNEMVNIASDTHYVNDENKAFEKLVLISNPYINRGQSTYNAYNTGILHFNIADEDVYKDLYKVEIVNQVKHNNVLSRILIEQLDWNSFRVIASEDSFGVGNLLAKFVPNASVGDLKPFEFALPCEIGERATSIKAYRGRTEIQFIPQGLDTLDCEGTTSLTDDYNTSDGQRFKFEVLSTNTLDALSYYRIVIEPELLYINPAYVKVVDDKKYSPFVRYENGIEVEGQNYFNFNDADQYQLDKYSCLISLRKDGREIIFNYDDVTRKFVSELLRDNIIEAKYVSNDNGRVPSDFAIDIQTAYDGRYNQAIIDNGFEKLGVNYKLAFTRQRKVETVTYLPYEVSYSQNNKQWIGGCSDTEQDWKFKLTDSMLKSTTNHYGIQINQLKGIYNSNLTDVELKDIVLTLQVHNKLGKECNIGVAKYDLTKHAGASAEYAFSKTLNFTFDTLLENNIILLGAIDSSKEVDFGEYYLEFTQNGIVLDESVPEDVKTNKSNRSIEVYKLLSQEDLSLRIPNADFSGDNYLDIAYTLIEDQEDFNSLARTEIYTYDGEGYVLCTENSGWAENTYYKKNLTYILASNSIYDLNVNINEEQFADAIEIKGLTEKVNNSLIKIEDVNNYYSKLKITTHEGLYTEDGNNYIKLTITASVEKYNYFGKAEGKYKVDKVIYFYVYEKINTIIFDHTNIIKYDNSEIAGTGFEERQSKQTLNILINGAENNVAVKNYIQSIVWAKSPSGIDDIKTSITDNVLYNTYVFDSGASNSQSSAIYATVKQFGSTYNIVCNFTVIRPILTEDILLHSSISYFKSGTSFINLKTNEDMKIDANNYSSEGDVSLPGLNYYACNQFGYATDIVGVDTVGKLTALKAGKAKLVIVAKDRLKGSVSGNILTWLENNLQQGYLVIDILVSDGSKQNPYLVANENDLRSIAKHPDKHFALINDVNIGVMFTIGEFSGSLVSYQEDYGNNTRFAIHGINITKQNSNFITTLSGIVKDIDFYVNVDYKSTALSGHAYIGLIGTNKGNVNNITVTIFGQLSVTQDVKNSAYYFGSIVANNQGNITISNTELVGVQGKLSANVNGAKEVYLGGAVGVNTGTISGAVDKIQPDNINGVEYSVFYDNQGAFVDLELAVEGIIGNDLNTQIGTGLVVGHNAEIDTQQGVMKNVYSTGSINAPTIDVVGGLIGQNTGNKLSGTITTDNATYPSVQIVIINDTDAEYQVENSYSTAVIRGQNRVGGCVGYDNAGSYKKVYYEIYNKSNAIKGNTEVGGLIGWANSSTINYCYVNSFIWGYAQEVDYYEIIGTNYVGGLIGRADGSTTNFSDTNNIHITNSVASVTLQGGWDVAGLVGQFNLYGGIYNAYFYGLINADGRQDPVTNVYNQSDFNTNNIPYNNVYSINKKVQIDRGNITIATSFDNNSPFTLDNNADNKYNNGYPYIEYNSKPLITVVPKTINISNAIVKQDANGKYVLINNNYVLYDSSNPEHQDKDKYIITAIYEIDSQGEYVRDRDDKTTFVEYNSSKHSGWTRYTLRTIPINTEISDNGSVVKNNIITAYYYQFESLVEENAMGDMRALNTLDMHKVLSDNEIKVNPLTVKRFSLISSDNNIVSVLANGKLLLKKEGVATITLVSTLNPNATASFTIVVRTKVVKFGLYSNSNFTSEYLINNSNLSVAKNQSKIIYADYSGVIEYFNRAYKYNSATNVVIKFNISANDLPTGKTVDDYITFSNSTKTENVNGEYKVTYGKPITISVKEHFEAGFNITATPYIVVNYEGKEIEVNLPSSLTQTFNVLTRKGVSSVTPDKTRIEMMPIDDSKVDVEIATDCAQSSAKIEIIGFNEKGEYETIIKNPILTQETAKYWEMLDIKLNGTEIDLSGSSECGKQDNITLPISDFDAEKNLQIFSLDLGLNEKSYYIEHEFSLEVRITIDGKVGIFNIFVKPQQVSTLMALNYKVNEDENTTADSLEDIQISKVIRPGKRNIIVVDVAPNIAVYDYLEIEDITYVDDDGLNQTDKILFTQLTSELKAMSEQDQKSASGYGIKLKKSSINTSQMYVSAILPKSAVLNNTHTLKITAYNNDGKELKNITISVEAVLYPQIVLDYSYPNGKPVDSVKTIDDYYNIKYGKPINLAVGVEAGIQVTTSNIDEGSLTYTAKIGGGDKSGKDFVEDDTLSKLVSVTYEYDKYMLRFDLTDYDKIKNLVGKKIQVTFKASKTLNTIIETCQATMEFDLQHVVVHSVSLEHNTLNNTIIYGNYEQDENINFYFAPTDVSYYNPITKNYWRTMYTLTNTKNAVSGSVLNRLYTILNTLNTDSNNTYSNITGYDTGDEKDNTKVDITYGDGITIKAQPKSNINEAKLDIKFKLKYNSNYPEITTDTENIVTIDKSYGFMFSTKTNPFEKYEEIKTEEDFLSMQEGKHYQLMNDLVFDNYLPISTNIAALNGNCKTITIKSFDIEGLSQLYPNGIAYVGLFGTINQNTVIQNLQVDYPGGVKVDLSGYILLDGNTYTELYFGGIAGVNLGVITNVNVMGTVSVSASQLVPTLIHIGGIAGANGSNDSANNVDLVANITNSTSNITLKGLGIVGGVADINIGKITTTKFTGTIYCYDNSGSEYVGKIHTAGLAVNNYGGIYLSGVEKGDSSDKQIRTVGLTGGFVAVNHVQAEINNCYIQSTDIASQGRIGGFVYENNGIISKAYANAVIENSLFYENFISIGSGTLIDCYASNQQNEASKINGLTNIWIDDPSNKLAQKATYNNFTFATTDYGVWSISNKGPIINDIGYTSNTSIFNVYDVETYEGFFERAKNNDNIVRDYFRIVRDIDLSTLTENPTTSQIVFQGKFEGNGLTISGYNLYNNIVNVGTGRITSVGLFNSIKQNANEVFVRNIVLKPNSIRASEINIVGGLAGIIDGGYIYNVKIDNNSLLIIGRNAVGGLAGIVRGEFEVDGITTNVSAFASYRERNSNGQYNIYTGKNVLGTTIGENVAIVSYAGSIAAIIDGYTDTGLFDNYNRNITNYFAINNISLEGALTISAETVGAVAGLVGESTLLTNVTYYISSQTRYKGVFSSGGLVGENRGIIANVNVFKDESDNEQTVDYSNNFNNVSRINGGIVGINLGGFIYQANTYTTVYNNTDLANVGGIVGRNIAGYVYNCAMYGEVSGEFSGLIVGVDYSYDLMLAQNRYATPTSNTRIVYERTLNNGAITYELSYKFSDISSISGRYKGVAIGKDSLLNFINKITDAYEFNLNYGEQDKNLMISKKVTGLLIGLTDSEFELKTELDNDKLIINLDVEVRNNYELTINSNKYNVNALGNIIISGIGTKFVYLIGYQGSNYDYWTPTQGYSDKLIIFTSSALKVVEDDLTPEG